MKTLRATANKSKRTFTIRKYVGGKIFSKFRTSEMSKDEFEECEYNTESDWKDFLNNGSYYSVKINII